MTQFEEWYDLINKPDHELIKTLEKTLNKCPELQEFQGYIISVVETSAGISANEKKLFTPGFEDKYMEIIERIIKSSISSMYKFYLLTAFNEAFSPLFGNNYFSSIPKYAAIREKNLKMYKSI